jgi:hypothetical protein
MCSTSSRGDFAGGALFLPGDLYHPHDNQDFRRLPARFRCSAVRPGKVIRGLAEETE